MPSAALLAAQAALLERRANDGIKPAHVVKRPSMGDGAAIDAGPGFALANAQATLEQYQARDGVALTRPAASIDAAAIVQAAVSTLSTISIPTRPAASGQPFDVNPIIAQEPSVKTHPTLLGQLQKDGQATLALYWLLIKLLDIISNGKSNGWATKEGFKDSVTANGMLNRRSANAIIRKLDGVFIDIDEENGRLYHRSPEKVALHFGYGKASGLPVFIPFSRLTSGVQMFKATIHEALFSGRPSGSRGGNLSRQTIQDITGASPKSQRTYEALTGIIATPCYAFLATSDEQDAAWEANQAAFVFTDHHNIQGGGKGKKYTARTLPNTFETSKSSPLKRASKSGTKRFNARVRRTDNEEVGNGQKRKTRVYFKDAKSAAKANGRHYIPSSRRATAQARKRPYTFMRQIDY